MGVRQSESVGPDESNVVLSQAVQAPEQRITERVPMDMARERRIEGNGFDHRLEELRRAIDVACQREHQPTRVREFRQRGSRFLTLEYVDARKTQ